MLAAWNFRCICITPLILSYYCCSGVWWVFVCIGACWGFCGYTNHRNCTWHVILSICRYIFVNIFAIVKMALSPSSSSKIQHRPHHMHIEWHTWFEVITAHCSLDQHPRVYRFMYNGINTSYYGYVSLSPYFKFNI